MYVVLAYIDYTPHCYKDMFGPHKGILCVSGVQLILTKGTQHTDKYISPGRICKYVYLKYTPYLLKSSYHTELQ